jgi:alpha-1,6-mannosyltransferase
MEFAEARTAARTHAPITFPARLRAAIQADSAWLTNLALLLFGLLFIDLTRTGTGEFHHYIHGFSAGLFAQLILYLGAIALVERSATNRWTLPILLAVALAARLVAIAQPPFLSTDIYRYVWDGKVQLAGINPFRYIPADPHLAFLRDTHIYPHINRRSYAHTIYPPGAQFVFLVIARIHASVVCMRLAFVAFEAVTCWVLIRCLHLLALPSERIILYAWHPVCIWEIASSGHVDAPALTFIALALYAALLHRPLRSTGWLAIATLIKLYPATLLPALTRRRILAPLLLFTGIVVAGYLPYLSVGKGVFGFLPSYAKEEGLETGVRYFPLALAERTFHISIAPAAYVLACAVLMAGLAAWAWQRSDHPAACIRSGLVLATALNLCFSPHYPWYFLWLLPFLALWPWRPAFYTVIAATYLLSTRFGANGAGIYGMNVRLYGGFFFLLALDLFQNTWLRRSAARSTTDCQSANRLPT